jgi:hypothetical protein
MLLDTFYTTFKVNRLDIDGGIVLSKRKWHRSASGRIEASALLAPWRQGKPTEALTRPLRAVTTTREFDDKK